MVKKIVGEEMDGNIVSIVGIHFTEVNKKLHQVSGIRGERYSGDKMKQQKYTGMQKFQANSLENNIGGFTDPELWEAVKKIYGGVTQENQHRCWLDYWKAMGEKGTWRTGHFETDYEYANEKIVGLI